MSGGPQERLERLTSFWDIFAQVFRTRGPQFLHLQQKDQTQEGVFQPPVLTSCQCGIRAELPEGRPQLPLSLSLVALSVQSPSMVPMAFIHL